MLLTAIAVTQPTYAHRGTLTSWKGGRFGMFARADSPSYRFLLVIGVSNDGREWYSQIDSVCTGRTT
jgi:hypothetical protein